MRRESVATPRPTIDVEHPLPLEQALVVKLAIAVNLNTSVFHQLYARRHDLTLTDWRVLAVLVSRPGISATELSEILAVDKMSITRAVQRLLERGRIRATANPHDRRRLSLAVTSKGGALYDKIAPQAWNHQDRCLHDLSAAERAELGRLLDKIIGSVRRMKTHVRRPPVARR